MMIITNAVKIASNVIFIYHMPFASGPQVVRVAIRELKHAHFWNADSTRKRKFHMPEQWCLPSFYTNHL